MARVKTTKTKSRWVYKRKPRKPEVIITGVGMEQIRKDLESVDWNPHREAAIEQAKRSIAMNADSVNHPMHYGGAENPYEAIKVIEAWGLGFRLGNAVKYISRAEHKGSKVEDLKKARWYLDREITNLENK